METEIRTENIRNLEEAEAAVRTALAALEKMKTTCCNIDNARCFIQSAQDDIGRFWEWQSERDIDEEIAEGTDDEEADDPSWGSF